MAVEPVSGVFYERKKLETGTMATRRIQKKPLDLHYFCKSTPEGNEVALYLLKPTGEPTSIVMETVSRETFDLRFKDCSTHKCELKPVSEEGRKKEAAEAKVGVGQRHLDHKEYHAAAFEFGQAVKYDDQNLKAHLGKGKAHMSLGEVDKARESFEKISKIDDLYETENKHIFNEYGIELRRGELYDLAIENYKKAISIDAEDEALYFNISRAYMENGRMEEAVGGLEKALSINPDFKEAKMLLDAIKKNVSK